MSDIKSFIHLYTYIKKLIRSLHTQQAYREISAIRINHDNQRALVVNLYTLVAYSQEHFAKGAESLMGILDLPCHPLIKCLSYVNTVYGYIRSKKFHEAENLCFKVIPILTDEVTKHEKQAKLHNKHAKFVYTFANQHLSYLYLEMALVSFKYDEYMRCYDFLLRAKDKGFAEKEDYELAILMLKKIYKHNIAKRGIKEEKERDMQYKKIIKKELESYIEYKGEKTIIKNVELATSKLFAVCYKIARDILYTSIQDTEDTPLKKPKSVVTLRIAKKENTQKEGYQSPIKQITAKKKKKRPQSRVQSSAKQISAAYETQEKPVTRFSITRPIKIQSAATGYRNTNQKSMARKILDITVNPLYKQSLEPETIFTAPASSNQYPLSSEKLAVLVLQSGKANLTKIRDPIEYEALQIVKAIKTRTRVRTATAKQNSARKQDNKGEGALEKNTQYQNALMETLTDRLIPEEIVVQDIPNNHSSLNEPPSLQKFYSQQVFLKPVEKAASLSSAVPQDPGDHSGATKNNKFSVRQTRRHSMEIKQQISPIMDVDKLQQQQKVNLPETIPLNSEIHDKNSADQNPNELNFDNQVSSVDNENRPMTTYSVAEVPPSAATENGDEILNTEAKLQALELGSATSILPQNRTTNMLQRKRTMIDFTTLTSIKIDLSRQLNVCLQKYTLQHDKNFVYDKPFNNPKTVNEIFQTFIDETKSLDDSKKNVIVGFIWLLKQCIEDHHGDPGYCDRENGEEIVMLANRLILETQPKYSPQIDFKSEVLIEMTEIFFSWMHKRGLTKILINQEQKIN